MAVFLTNGPTKVPVYNSPLFAACGGKLYSGYPFGPLIPCLNQASPPLRDNVLISMCFLNLTIFAVDGITITTVPLATNTVTPYVTASTDAAPVAPTLGQAAGGTIAATKYFVTITYTTTTGETVASLESSFTTTASHLLKVLSPAAQTNATTWSVYASAISGSETLQASGIAIGTDWTEPTTGLALGVTPPQGLAPTNCFLCCNWRGRFVLAGDSNNPQNFYMARTGVPTDWNYAATDPAAAVAGNLSESGQIGEPIVALIPYTDDYMLIGCTNSLWMLQGDPADGGSIVRVSDQMGLVSPNAWCVDPTGTMYFIARGGLYSVRPIWEFYQPPQLLSGESYDQYFQQIINGNSYYISMQWDVDAKYMHIFATNTFASPSVHLIFDQRNGGLWPQQYPNLQGPTASVRYAANNVNGGQRAILLGGFDGFIRQWTLTNLNDDGTAISAYAVLGPVKPNPEASILSGVTLDFGEVTAADNQTAPNVIEGATITQTGSQTGTIVITGTLIPDTLQIYITAGVPGLLPLPFLLGNPYDYSYTGSTTLTIQFALPIDGITFSVNYQSLGSPPTPWNALVTVQAGPDAYSVTEGTPHSTAAVPSTLDRRQKMYRQRFRGGWFSMKISNNQFDTYFSFESALLEFLDAGRNRDRR